MAYTDDAVRAKLSALNETQESIVTVAQWVMFHRRYADRTGQLWLQRLKDSSPGKRLNLIYLANEVVQQSKARKKDDFLRAFSPIVVDATVAAYKGASSEIQQKLRRVIEVWRARQIFDIPTQDAIEARVDELDKNRSSGKKPLLGGSLFSTSGSSTPPELQPLVPLQTALTKAELAARPAVTAANSEHDKLADPSSPTPTPPVHAARLSSVLKALANAQSAVAESLKTRAALIEGLEKVLASNRAALAEEEAQRFALSSRKVTMEAKKRDVEDGIMRGLSAESTPVPESFVPGAEALGGPAPQELGRPDVEALTPPPIETLTPTRSPPSMFDAEQHAPFADTTGAEVIEEQEPDRFEAPPAFQPPLVPVGAETGGLPGLSSMKNTHDRPPSSGSINGTGASASPNIKRRKMAHALDEFADFVNGDAMAGIDDDVAAMLGEE